MQGNSLQNSEPIKALYYRRKRKAKLLPCIELHYLGVLFNISFAFLSSRNQVCLMLNARFAALFQITESNN